MADDNMDELRHLVTRLARLVETMGEQQQQANTRWDGIAERWEAMAGRWDTMAARWDGYIVEQRAMNARLLAILEGMLPGGGNGHPGA